MSVGGERVRVHESVKARHHHEATHHPGLHHPDSLILCVVRRIGRTVEKVVDSMAGIHSHDRTAVGTGDGFANKQRTMK